MDEHGPSTTAHEHGPSTTAHDDVRWLGPAEQEAWRTFLEATRGVFERLEHQLATDAHMPMAYYDILVALSEAPDHALRMGELARRLRSSSSRLAHAMSRLEDHGWVRREAVLSDRRGAVAVLTPAGSDRLRAVAPGHVDAVRRHLIDALTPEQLTRLTEISRAILDRVDEVDRVDRQVRTEARAGTQAAASRRGGVSARVGPRSDRG